MTRLQQVLLVWMTLMLACCYGDHHADPFSSWSILEMNHDLGEGTIHWPSVRPFTIVKTNINERKYWVISKEFCSNEHAGTHIDAPLHFSKEGWSVDKIPFDRLVDRPLVKVDIRSRVEKDPDTQLLVDDLLEWESKHGRIADGSVVLMYSGWANRFWPNATAYYGTSTLNDSSTYHYPGFHPDASKWLIDNRNIYGIGVDTASGDFGQNKGALTHRLLNAENIYILENVANLDQVPSSGALITIMPIKIRGGTGGPSRIFARIPKDNLGTGASPQLQSWSFFELIAVVVATIAL